MCIYSFTLTHIWLHICSLSCISDKDANKRRRGKKKNSSLIFSSQAGRKSGHSKPWCDRKRRSPDRRISSSTSITMTHVCPTVRDTLRRKKKKWNCVFDCALMVQHTVFVGPLFKHWNKFQFWASSSLRTFAIHLHMECRLIIIVCSPSTTSVCRLMTKQYIQFFPKSILLACILATNLGSFPGGLSHVLNTLTYSPTLTTKYLPALWWQLSRQPRLCACISFDWLCGVRGWDNCNFLFLEN